MCEPFGDLPPSKPLENSFHLQDTLYDLRRQSAKPKKPVAEPGCGAIELLQKDADFDVAEDQAVHKGKDGHEEPNEEFNPLLKAILGDKHDTEAQLAATTASLEQGSSEAVFLGGARHPTNLVTGRALQVAKRKVHLLHIVEERLNAYIAANKNRNALLISLAYEKGTPPPELMGVERFVEKYSNWPANPVEDPGRFDFPTFVKTFKLHAEHDVFKQFRKVGDECGLWWAEKCLEMASKGGDQNCRASRLKAMNGEKVDVSYRLGHQQLQNIFAVAEGSGMDMTSPKMMEIRGVLNDRLAEAVLADAKKLHFEDEKMAAESQSIPFGPASKTAETIEKAIAECIADGCPDCHPKLELTRNIVKALYHVDGERKRLAAREKRMAGQPAH